MLLKPYHLHGPYTPDLIFTNGLHASSSLAGEWSQSVSFFGTLPLFAAARRRIAVAIAILCAWCHAPP